MDASKTSLPRQVPDAVFIPQTPLTPFNYLRFLVLQPVCLTEKCVCVCVYTPSTWAGSFPLVGNTRKAAKHLHGNQPLSPTGFCSVGMFCARQTGTNEAT